MKIEYKKNLLFVMTDEIILVYDYHQKFITFQCPNTHTDFFTE